MSIGSKLINHIESDFTVTKRNWNVSQSSLQPRRCEVHDGLTKLVYVVNFEKKISWITCDCSPYQNNIAGTQYVRQFTAIVHIRDDDPTIYQPTLYIYR